MTWGLMTVSNTKWEDIYDYITDLSPEVIMGRGMKDEAIQKLFKAYKEGAIKEEKGRKINLTLLALFQEFDKKQQKDKKNEQLMNVLKSIL